MKTIIGVILSWILMGVSLSSYAASSDAARVRQVSHSLNQACKRGALKGSLRDCYYLVSRRKQALPQQVEYTRVAFAKLLSRCKNNESCRNKESRVYQKHISCLRYRENLRRCSAIQHKRNSTRIQRYRAQKCVKVYVEKIRQRRCPTDGL